MSLLSSSVSITCYKVSSELQKPVLDTVYNGLTRHTIRSIDDEPVEKTVGWTSFKNPYLPDFESSSFVIGSYLVFSLRLDKKTIPANVIRKNVAIEMEKQLKRSGRSYLSANEKKTIKDHVTASLVRRIPATPNVYDVVWNLEEYRLWFFSNLKAANEALETLFLKSFNLTLIHLFPYTTADLVLGLEGPERDRLTQLEPTKFTES
ncbi:MAG: recombination-associated protein RdgC [Desulfobacterales bacterium]|nr:recombination-associated protein RdgC [Desulfobacterales bacterium]